MLPYRLCPANFRSYYLQFMKRKLNFSLLGITAESRSAQTPGIKNLLENRLLLVAKATVKP